MSQCFLSQSSLSFFPESLLLPVMLFLTLVSEPADLSFMGSDFFGKGITGVVFDSKHKTLLSFFCYRPVSAVQSGVPGLASPPLA